MEDTSRRETKINPDVRMNGGSQPTIKRQSSASKENSQKPGAQQVGEMPDSNENLHGWKTLIRTGIENIIKVCNR